MSWGNQIFWNGKDIESGSQSVVFVDLVLLTDCVAFAEDGTAPEWKEDTLALLKAVSGLPNVGFIPVMPRAYGYTLDSLNGFLKEQHIRAERLLEAEDTAERAKVIGEYIHGRQILSYAVIDREDLSTMDNCFLERIVVVDEGKFDQAGAEEKINNSLYHAPWWSEQYIIATSERQIAGKLIERDYKKVVFLDIDGVLNDDGEDSRINGLNAHFVENLAKIVKATDADIILTSSWRTTIVRYLYYNDRSYEKDVKQLFDLLKENDLHISGMTPRFFNGPDGRPFEIRTWLAHRPNVTHFVILDDEPFWKWNWLKPHVVTTSKRVKGEKGKRRFAISGLSDEYVEAAIKILTED